MHPQDNFISSIMTSGSEGNSNKCVWVFFPDILINKITAAALCLVSFACRELVWNFLAVIVGLEVFRQDHLFSRDVTESSSTLI